MSDSKKRKRFKKLLLCQIQKNARNHLSIKSTSKVETVKDFKSKDYEWNRIKTVQAIDSRCK